MRRALLALSAALGLAGLACLSQASGQIPNAHLFKTCGGVDSFAKLMLHLNGTNASTTFTDGSLSPRTMTANGNVAISTAQSKFGGSSGTFDGTTDYLTAPDSADWFLSNSNFTLDLWVRASAIGAAAAHTLVFQGQDINNYQHFFLDGDATIGFKSTVASATMGAYSTTATFTANTWYHVAFVRNGTSFLIFVNGVSQTLTTITAISTNALGNYTSVLYIGDNVVAPLGLNGFLDELRWSNGIARWTANFPAPTQQYCP